MSDQAAELIKAVNGLGIVLGLVFTGTGIMLYVIAYEIRALREYWQRADAAQEQENEPGEQ